MKRFAIILSLGVMSIAACQRKELETSAPVAIREVEFVAELAGDQTRTHFDADYKLFWSTQESINVFYGPSTNSPGSLFVSQNAEPSSSATFRGTIESFTGINEDGESYSYWGVYPYSENNRSTGSAVQVELPTVQTGLVGNIEDNTALMVAQSYGLTLRFHNVGTLFRLTFSSDDIKAVTFRGNNGEIVSGKVNVTMNADGEPEWERIVGEGKTYIQLKAPNDGTFAAGAANEYYIVTLPQTFSNGVTVTYQKVDGSFGSYKVTGSVTCDREGTKNLKLRDESVTFSSYVDLGNGLKFATVNIGGASATEAGEQFAWGETTTKSTYSWDNYFWGTERALTKYNATDGKTVLEPEDDAATVICGEGWHTPTLAEWDALRARYRITYNTDKTVTFTSVSDNTKSITLYADAPSSLYWSSTLADGSYTYAARVLTIENGTTQRVSTNTSVPRATGYYIRAIYTSPVHVTTISLNKGALNLTVGRSETLVATITPSDATKPGIQWTSSDDAVATVDENGTVTAVAEGAATITARTVDGGHIATCAVAVGASQNQSYVDMGAGHFWAVCNLGADFPEEFGDYYAWGELEPKDEYPFSPYNFDNTAFADAASHVLGENWRTPASEDYEWLLDNCDRAWVLNYNDSGISGYRFISREDSGNQIFFPAAGFKFNSNHNYANQEGYYWSSSIKASENDRAFNLFFSASSVNGSDVQRPLGLSIRPVLKVSVTGISLNASSLSLVVGDTYQLSATLAPDNASEQVVIWSSSNESVVTVNVAGGVKAVGAGGATIIATTLDGRFTATCTVMVNPLYVQMGGYQVWATCDLVPDSNSEHKFSWGALAAGGGSWSNYPLGDSATSITKYQFPDGKTDASWYDSNGNFIGDGIGVLKPEDDAATAMWGNEWRIPTRSDWEWLLDNCVWIRQWNKDCYLVISNADGYEGNQITLPVDQICLYWSSTIDGYDSSTAYCVDLDENAESAVIHTAPRCSTLRIRPVRSPKIDVTGITLNQTALTMIINRTKSLTATITPYNASEKHVVWASSNPSVATVSAEGVVTAVSSGTATITAIIDQNKRATCEVTVEPIIGTLDGHDWVDMGNGLKWATMNIGSPSAYNYSGRFYAWGMTTTSTDYTRASYSYHENPSTLPPSNDIATEEWGSSWRMPTKEDFDWLLDNCTQTWVEDYNGGYDDGLLFTSKSNGNKLFFPALGYREGVYELNMGKDLQLYEYAHQGHYWSSSLNENSTDSAWYLEIADNYFATGHNGKLGVEKSGYRYYGRSVRPVSGSSNE